MHEGNRNDKPEGMISSLLIANRGEIACRIRRTASAMGVRCVAVYSDADAEALHIRGADAAVRIGPAPAAESYLCGDVIIQAALDHGVEAIHPGYGFLAENADFAEAVVAAGLIFVGPPASAIRAMGAKAAAKALMQACGVPIVPGYHGVGQGADTLAAEAEQVGYPLLIKASLGGGGKGMRRVDEPDAFEAALAATKREALAAFGDDRVIIERYVSAPRHIEVQVFADTHGNFVHMFERDCSLQRRHQKLIEEAPAPGMTEALRQRMTDAAIEAARAVDYVGAGTVEFIVDGSQPLGDDTEFYFMEMNARLQVEHPVTEAITGYDLVEWQLRAACCEPLPCAQKDINISGHSVEARLCAETPQSGFLPSTGPILRFRPPSGPGIRVDSGIAEGGEVSPHYDPMIAKIIATGETRAAAVGQLDAALAKLEFAGPNSNQAFLRHLLADDAFQKAQMDTGLIDAELERLLEELKVPEPLIAAGVIAVLRMAREGRTHRANEVIAPGSPWGTTDAFQIGPARTETCDILVDGKPKTIHLSWQDGVPCLLNLAPPLESATIMQAGSGVIAIGEGFQVTISLADPFASASEVEIGDGTLVAPMPGQLIGVAVAEGEAVSKGQVLMQIEAMKMEHAILAPFDGVVGRLEVAAGDRVDLGAMLAVVEAHASEPNPSENT